MRHIRGRPSSALAIPDRSPHNRVRRAGGDTAVASTIRLLLGLEVLTYGDP